MIEQVVGVIAVVLIAAIWFASGSSCSNKALNRHAPLEMEQICAERKAACEDDN
jgi:hypothetical protein